MKKETRQEFQLRLMESDPVLSELIKRYARAQVTVGILPESEEVMRFYKDELKRKLSEDDFKKLFWKTEK